MEMTKLINLQTNTAKRREWARQLRLTISLERKFARDVAKVLKRQYRDAAKYVNSFVYDADQAVINHAWDMRDEFKSNYVRIANTFSEDVFKEFEKSMHIIETKTLMDDFWRFMTFWITTNSAKQVQKVNNTTKKILRNIINKSIDTGDTNEQTARKIREVGEISTITRARTIARTETHTAAMKSTKEAMGATRQIRMKEWISANDSRTRTKMFDHRKADGEHIGFDDFFVNTDEALEYPGDFRGSAGNIINCRCGVLYYTQ